MDGEVLEPGTPDGDQCPRAGRKPAATVPKEDPKIVLPGAGYFASFPAVTGWPLYGNPKTSDGRQLSGIEDAALTSNLPEPPSKHPE